MKPVCPMQDCSELGIKGRNIPQELAQLQQQLPGLFQEALTDINSPAITSAMEHYAAFTAYAHSASPDAAAAEPSSLLPHLHAIRSSSETPQHTDRASDGTHANGLAHDSHAGTAAAAAATDDENDNEIQWDITQEADESSAAQEHADGEFAAEGNGDIDWDFAIEPSANSTGTAI